jgi:hypothetical protein
VKGAGCVPFVTLFIRATARKVMQSVEERERELRKRICAVGEKLKIDRVFATCFSDPKLGTVALLYALFVQFLLRMQTKQPFLNPLSLPYSTSNIRSILRMTGNNRLPADHNARRRADSDSRMLRGERNRNHRTLLGPFWLPF